MEYETFRKVKNGIESVNGEQIRQTNLGWITL